MSVKINFKKSLSGYYFVDEDQTFTKKEVDFIKQAINEALKKKRESDKAEQK